MQAEDAAVQQGATRARERLDHGRAEMLACERWMGVIYLRNGYAAGGVRMNAKVILIVLALVTSLAVVAQADQTVNAEGYSELSVSGMVLQWKVVGSDLQVIVSAPTTGWVAVGFGPSRRMQNANIIIGYVKDGEVTVSDQFGVAQTAHKPDESLSRGESNVTGVSGSESAGRTELRWTIPLNSGDRYDKALRAGGKQKVILAYGKNEADDLVSYHAFRTTVEITL